ncbi:TPA: hypothetical protein VCL27_001474 [Streptococcus pyogenes]|nr:hypothetical protein [Streptococcus pyogenes]
MVMIEVSHLQKNFSKTIKEPGLKGALKSFVHPQREIFEAVKDLSFEVPKGQILGFIGANGAGDSDIMMTDTINPLKSKFKGFHKTFKQDDLGLSLSSFLLN